MHIDELPILNGKKFSAEDMGKLIDVLENSWEQGQSFISSAGRGMSQESCIYLFPKTGANSEIDIIKSIVDKYGVKSDVYLSRYHGVHKVVRIMIENVDQGMEYRSFGNSVAMFLREKCIEEERIAEQQRVAAEKAARQAKIQKIFPIIRLFQKKK